MILFIHHSFRARDEVSLLTVQKVKQNQEQTQVTNLRLAVPPYVARTTPSAVEVREGHNVTLSCRAFGEPPPTVIWRRVDRQIIRFNGATGYGGNFSLKYAKKKKKKHFTAFKFHKSWHVSQKIFLFLFFYFT